MTWFPWSESIKRRACRYLLEHYLGSYLQEKLKLEQLSLDVYHGKGYVQNVQLDVNAVNEALSHLHLPFEIVHGSIGSIAVYMPWSALLKESCEVEINGLNLVAQLRQSQNVDFSSMTDSFCNSLKNMTTSMEFAEQCFNEESKGNKDEGFQLLVETVERVLSRIKVTFTDTTLQLEHAYSPSNGVGLKISIQDVQYSDEDYSSNDSSANECNPSSSAASFITKRFMVSGITVSLYELYDKQSEDDYKLNDASDCIIAQFFGSQQIKFRIKQDEQLSGPKVDGDLYLGSCAVFLTPKQVSLLLGLINCISTSKRNGADDNTHTSNRSSSRPMAANDYRYVENQLLAEHCRGGLSDLSEVLNMDTCNSETTKDHFFSMDGVSEQFYSFNSCSASSDGRRDGFNHKRPADKADDKSECCNEVIENIDKKFRFQVQFLMMLLTILEDPFSQPCDNGDEKDLIKDMSAFLEKYFKDLKTIFNKYTSLELFKKRDFFNDALRNRNHLRLLAGPVHVEYVQGTSFKLQEFNESLLNMSIGDMELVECLYNPCDTPNTKRECTCVEILMFPSDSRKSSTTSHEKCVNLTVNRIDKVDRINTKLSIKLSDVKSEVDITMMDRVASLLFLFDSKSEEQAHTNIDLQASTLDKEALFAQVCNDQTESIPSELNLVVSSSEMNVDFRFPIPDLRDVSHKEIKCTRSLRDETLHLIAKDMKCVASVFTGPPSQPVDEMWEMTLQFQCLHALYSDEGKKPPRLFLEATKSDGQDDTQLQESFTESSMPFIKITEHPTASTRQLVLSEKKHFYDLKFNDKVSIQMNDPMMESQYDHFQPKEPTPFSSCKEVHGDTEKMIPGNQEELKNFKDHASAMSAFHVAVHFPVVKIYCPSMPFFESLYNRINNDLLLWMPSSAQPTEHSVYSENVPDRLDTASQFFSLRNDLFSSTEEEPHTVKSSKGMTDKKAEYLNNDDDDYDDFIPSQFQSLQSEGISIPSERSAFTISLSINDGLLSLCSDLNIESDAKKTGQLYLAINNGNLFTSCSYCGNPNVDYTSIDISSFSIYHKVRSSSSVQFETVPFLEIPPNLTPVAYPNEDGVEPFFHSGRRNIPVTSGKKQKMLSIALKVVCEEKRALKHFVVAVMIQGMTIKHQFLPLGHSWFEQIIGIMDIEDEPVVGYEPPAILTEIHFHARKCAADYQPLYLAPPLRVLATISSFSLSSNVVAGSPVSLLHMILDDSSVHLSDSTSMKRINRQHFVTVLDVNLLEVILKLANSKAVQLNESEAPQDFPQIDLSIENVQVLFKTCFDSCAAFIALLRYIIQDGDLAEQEFPESVSSSQYVEAAEEKCNNVNLSKQSSKPSDQRTSPVQATIADLMADAMKDMDLFSDDDKSSMHSDYLSSVDTETVPSGSYLKDASDYDDDEFCIISDPDHDPCDDKPILEYFKPDEPISVVKHWFKTNMEKINHLHTPCNYPSPVKRYNVTDLSCCWCVYGGTDFGRKENCVEPVFRQRTYSREPLPSDYSPRTSRADNKTNQSGRNHDVVVEFHVTKFRFKHEVFPDNASPDEARTVFTINDFEIRDRLHSSQINKLLYQFHNEDSPKQSNANMLLVKTLHLKPEDPGKPAECRLRVTLQPIRLNIDQDTLDFLINFFTKLSELFGAEGKTATPESCHTPQLSVSSGDLPSSNVIDEEESDNLTTHTFYREVIFTNDVPIRLDYHGKHIDIEQVVLCSIST
ncbi:autophagy-related protein 2 homolog B-like isoform X2 [Clavelina lepadiformis]|uniref:autophagy-related protein 2 homolog B-like isoform X2 n=1 Tax=Clavelina lepadiformis TaxID=159417 RepID=UPI004041FEF8